MNAIRNHARAGRRRGAGSLARIAGVLCVTALTLAPPAWAQAPYARFDTAPDAPDAQADAASEVAMTQAWRSWSQRSAAALAATTQPRELAFAALLQGLGNGPTPSQAAPAGQADTWQQAAAGRAGDDVLANALLAASGDTGTRVRAAQRWLGAEPQNLAPLLVRGGSVEAMLADTRAATTFDLHMLDQVRWMQGALLRTPASPAERAAFVDGETFVAEEHAAITASALWSSAVLPDLQPLLQACDPSATRDPARLGDCRHVAAVLAERSDTMLGRLIGLGLQARLAATPSERDAAQAHARTLHWQNLEWGRASAALPRDGAGQFVRFLADPSIRTEVQLVERALQDAGVALAPPAGWQPPR